MRERSVYSSSLITSSAGYKLRLHMRERSVSSMIDKIRGILYMCTKIILCTSTLVLYLYYTLLWILLITVITI